MSVANLTVRFACEVALVVALVWWGWPLLGIALGAAAIAVWAAWIAPKARRRLRDPLRLGVELALFAAAAAAFWTVGHHVLAVCFAVLAVATALLVRRWPEPVPGT